MITYNKLVNLMVFYIISTEWPINSIDYIKEKYEQIFLKYPSSKIKYSNEFISIVNNSVFHKNSKDLNLLYFCFKLNELSKKDNLNPKHFINVYNIFFDGYSSIDKNNHIKTLHVNLREILKNYMDKNEIFKFLYIRQKIQLNNND